MLDTCKWQMAVVEWELLRKNDYNYSKYLEEDIKAIENGDYVDGLQSGSIVYICNVKHDAINLTDYGITSRRPMALVWSSTKCKYLQVMLDALHPVVTAKDAIELNMKYGL